MSEHLCDHVHVCVSETLWKTWWESHCTVDRSTPFCGQLHQMLPANCGMDFARVLWLNKWSRTYGSSCYEDKTCLFWVKACVCSWIRVEAQLHNPIDHYHLPSLLGVLHWVWCTSCSANVITNVSPHCGHFHTFCRWSPNCADAVTVASSCRLVHMWQRECWVS